MSNDGKVVIELVGKDSATQTFIKTFQDMQQSMQKLEGQSKTSLSGLGPQFDGLSGKIGSFAGKISTYFMAIAASYASFKTIQDFFQGFQKLAETESALLKMAIRLNSTTEALSGLGYVAIKAGMDTESFNKSVERMQKNVSAAVLGNEQATTTIDDVGESSAKGAAALRELGLNAEILNQLPVDQKLVALAAAMKQNIDPADRSRIALDLFGKAGGQLIVALAAGPQAMQQWIDKMQQLGGVVSTQGAKAMSEAKAASTDLDIAYKNLSRELYEGVAPAFTYTLTELTKLILEMKRGGGEADIFGSKFNNTIGTVNNWGDNLIKQIPKIEDFAKSLLLIPPLTMIFGPLAALPSLKAGKESAGPYGEAAESFYGPAPLPKGLLGPGTRAKPVGAGKGGAAKELAMTEVTLFDRAEWAIKDTDDLVQEATKHLEKMLNSQERLVSGQKNYASEMAGLSPLLTDQLKYKEDALRLENDLTLLTLKRELDEKKITQSVHDEQAGLQALLTQAKRLSLEREKWATQGVSGGLLIAGVDMRNQARTWAATETAAFVKAMPRQVSSVMASSFVGFLQGKKTDFAQLGWNMAEGTVQKLLEGIMVQAIPSLLSGGFQTGNQILGGCAQGSNLLVQGGIGVYQLLISGAQAIIDALSGAGGIFGGISKIFGGIASIAGIIAAPFTGGLSAAATLSTWSSFITVKHEGGSLQYAHVGWPPPGPGEVDIRALRTERVLSPSQTRDYEAGMRAGGRGRQSGGDTFIIRQTIRQPLSQVDQNRAMRKTLIAARREKERRGQY